MIVINRSGKEWWKVVGNGGIVSNEEVRKWFNG
jgi:hypothetical protein